MKILAAYSPGEVRAAAVRDGVLQDYAIWRPGAPDGVGDLHRGRITALVPAMAGAFVALAEAEGFLPDSQGASDASEGLLLGVRITRAAQSGKGPRLTARLTAEEAALASAGPARLIRRGLSPLEELAARYPAALMISDDRPGSDTVFNPDLQDQIAALEIPEVPLPGGGRMSIDPTRALTAIDIDGGSATGDRLRKAASQYGFNREAMDELARQIRLRNLSGAILVDFAGLSPRRRAALEPDLRRALATDPVGPRLLGFTHLGLAEIVRPRVRPPLHELLAGPLAAGLAALREASRKQATAPGRRAVLRAGPPIIAALQADGFALPEFAHRSAYPMILRADPSLAGWRLEYRDG